MFTVVTSTLDRDLALHAEDRQRLEAQEENLANLRRQCESEPHMQTTLACQEVLDKWATQRNRMFKKDALFSDHMKSLQTSFANKAVEMQNFLWLTTERMTTLDNRFREFSTWVEHWLNDLRIAMNLQDQVFETSKRTTEVIDTVEMRVDSLPHRRDDLRSD